LKFLIPSANLKINCLVFKYYFHRIFFQMGSRITIILDENLERKLRAIQAKQIQKKKQSVSFTQIIHETLQSGLKNSGV
jgi:hypothetical protein